VTGLACLGSGQPDGGDLWIGEHDLRNRHTGGLGGWCATLGPRGDPVSDQSRLVLAPVGEWCRATDVAGEVQPLRERAVQIGGGQPNTVQPEVVACRRASGRDQHLGVDRFAAVGRRQPHRSAMDASQAGVAGVGSVGSRESDAEADVHPLRGQTGCDKVGHEGLKPRQQSPAADQHRHPGAERGQPAGCLAGHHATADNGDRAGNLDDSGGIPRAPRQGRLQELRDDRARAGGEYYRVPGVQSARALRAGYLDRPFAGQPAGTTDDADSRLLGPAHLALVDVVAHPRIPAGQ